MSVFDELQANTKAPQAAGKIHTDFEKGFIMAEIMKFDDFKEAGSENAVKVSRKSIFISCIGIRSLGMSIISMIVSIYEWN